MMLRLFGEISDRVHEFNRFLKVFKLHAPDNRGILYVPVWTIFEGIIEFVFVK